VDMEVGCLLHDQVCNSVEIRCDIALTGALTFLPARSSFHTVSLKRDVSLDVVSDEDATVGMMVRHSRMPGIYYQIHLHTHLCNGCSQFREDFFIPFNTVALETLNSIEASRALIRGNLCRYLGTEIFPECGKSLSLSGDIRGNLCRYLGTDLCSGIRMACFYIHLPHV
jgi:hypothetical protein